MAAAKNNTNSKKFKTPEKRKWLCKEWCEHLKKGFSKKSFPHCSPQTFKVYCKNHPKDFDTAKIKEAERRSRFFWEQIGIYGAAGKLKGFNPASWIFNMKNRFNWRDKQDITSADEQIEVIFHPSLKKKNN